MIIGIEGTGSQDWGNLEMRRTFVRRILDQTRLRPASYFIGPNMSGSDGQKIIDGAFQALMNGRHNKPIVLVGYSRGAAYCMKLAEMLANQYTEAVDYLVLFDAVARQREFDIPDNIPANVLNCFHAYRDPRMGSRYFFSNVGLKPANHFATKFVSAMFRASHGGMGGTWYDAKNDEGTVNWGDLPFVPKKVAAAIPYGFERLPFGADSNKTSEDIGRIGQAYNAAYNAVMPGGNKTGTLTPTDRNATNVPHVPQISTMADKAGSEAVAQWMWGLLISAKILPPGARWNSTAPPYSGSVVPGERNMIR